MTKTPNPIKDFMASCLGKEGAKALNKAAEREPVLSDVLAPRAILSWIDFATKNNYEGEIPGQDNSYVTLAKSETGFSGSITLNNDVYSFSDSSIYQLAGTIALSLGLEPDTLDSDIRDTVLVKLGKSVDLLCKAQVLLGELNKRTLDVNAGYKISHEHHDLGSGNMMTKVNVHSPTGEHVGAATFTHTGNTITPGTVVVDEDHQRKGLASAMYAHAEKQTGKKLTPSANQTPEGAALWSGNKSNPQFAKTDLPGTTAKPIKQLGPIEAAPPKKQPANARPPKLKLPKLQPLSLTKSEMETKCDMCGRGQFKDKKFKGCLCVSDLAKSISTTVYSDGCVLTFAPDVDKDSVRLLMRLFRSSDGE